MYENKTRRVDIIQRETAFERFIFRIEELTLRHETFDGAMTAPLKRLVLERGDAVAVLLHDPLRDCVLLCEQFRAATLSRGSGWIYELPAGIIDEGETPETSARRETLEETGQAVGDLTAIATVYPSPGGSSERIHIYYSRVTLDTGLPDRGGLAEEGEDIRIVLVPTDEALARLRENRVEDAKTVIALQWLEHYLPIDTEG